MKCFLLCLCFWLVLGWLPHAQAQTPAFDAWRTASPATQRLVLGLARRAFDAYALHRQTLPVPHPLPPCLAVRGAVFVSAMRAGAPRCCMGTLYPTQPTLAEEIIVAADAAAAHDYRFAPLRPGELSQIRLIVSLLSPPHSLRSSQLAQLDPTRDGLVVQCGDRSGVVLSGETGQVATMLAWGRIRAGAQRQTPVHLFQIESIRFVEPSPE